MFLIAGGALCCSGLTGAQTPAARGTAVPAASSASSAAMQDPTRPEIQPRLDVDRDPFASPDVEVMAPPATAANTVNGPAANGEAQKRQDGMYVLHADVDEVLLNCTVIDSKGHTVTNLTQGDFRVWEDGIQQTINAFEHQDQPVSMGILVDNSGSMRDKRGAVSAAAMKLLQESNPKDVSFVVNFNDRAYLDQGFTSDLVALHRGLSRFDSHGTTALYDAVAASADQLAKHAKDRKQVLLIITDGADNASRLDLRQAIRRVQDLGGPVVYTIGLLYDADKDESEQAHRALEMLSEETGGVAYFPRSLNEVDGIASDIARDIRNQYVVAYRSTKSMSLGGYRVVHVEAGAPKVGKLTVITRHGYYAKAQQVQTAEETKPKP
ncbi:MAG TPA: VWA domain-containing protein [Terracidiphilus sp.]|nr:VWA domain-containing protein [Terracidiphilus sp.]